MPGTKTPWREPALWTERIEAYRDYNKVGIEDALKYGEWFSGNLDSLRSTITGMLGVDTSAPLSNHIHVNTEAALSDLFFRNPEFLSRHQKRYGPPFTEAQARCETYLLNDWVDETDFFGEFRKTLLDGLLTPMMIFEVGYTCETGVDDEYLEAEGKHADAENLAMLGGGRPKVSEDDYHPGHIERHRRFLQVAEATLPAATLRYLKKHIAFHEDAATKGGEREMETVRYESIFGERVSMLCFACDPGASSAARRRWVGKWILRPIDEVRKNKRYDATARLKVQAADLSAFGRSGEVMRKGLKLGSDDDMEDQALLFEGIDLQHGEKILYSQGAEKPLLTTEYQDWRIAPSGPYITASFAWDPVRDCGVAPPRIYSGHQEYVSFFDALIASSARRCVPIMASVGNYIDQAEIDRITRGVPSALIALKDVPPGTDLATVIQRIPVPEPGRILFEARLLHERGAERYSGIGSAKSGGGDFSKTATASAIVADASTNLSEDRRSVVDDYMTRIARMVIRLARKRYSRAKMMDIAGMDANEWPDKWNENDIARDKGVSVIPGSSRRKDAAVELKLNVELLSVMAKIPGVPPQTLAELVKRALDSAGQFDLDTSAMDTQAQMMEIEALLSNSQGQPMQGGPQPSRGGAQNMSKPERRGPQGASDRAGVQQGAANVAPGGA